ncbi:MAG TPA: hypothetical protein PLD55_04460 [bacterium]|nr:hypothetical protein [bacterium]
MKIIYLFLLIILGCGDEMSKPEEFIFNTNETNTGSIESYEEDGFGYKEILKSDVANELFLRSRKWSNYVSRLFGKVYYLAPLTGSDSNSGTDESPFKTLEKALEGVEDGGFGTIYVKEGGDCVLNSDINIVGKSISLVILVNSIESDLIFTSYTNDGKNDIYGFNLYKGANLHLWFRDVKAPAPEDSGNEWKEGASCIRVFDQESSVTISSVNKTSFSSTAAAGDFLPSLVYNGKTGDVRRGKANVSVIGEIKTNNKGYVINANLLLATLNAEGAIDNPLFFIDGGVHINQVLKSGTLPTPLETFAIGTADGLTVSATLPITADSTSDDNISKTIAEFINGIQYLRTLNTSSPSSDISFASTRNGSGHITSMQIEFVGSLVGRGSAVSLLYSGESEGWFVESQKPKRFINVVTNINLDL